MMPNQFTDSLWGDEAFSAVLSQKPLWPMIQIVAQDTSPPLYYICEHLWFNIFGSSELAIRLLSFLFHLGTVLAVFLIAKLLWDKKTAFLAAILGFLNPFLFSYAFEGRMYAILAFTTSLSFYSYFRAFHQQQLNYKWKLIYALTTALALYSHHFAIFAVFVQVVWIFPLLLNKTFPGHTFFSKIFSLAWPFLVTLILYLPWLPSLYYQTSLVAGDFWLSTPNLKNLLELIGKFLIGSQGYKLRFIILGVVFAIALIRRWQIKNYIDGILLGWFFGPLLLTWLVSQVMQSIFFDRYMLYAIPASTMLLASNRRGVASLLGLFFIIVCFSWVDWHYFTHPSKRPFREVAAYVKQELRPQDALINWNSAAHHLWETKYYGIPAPIYSPGGPLPFYVGTAQMTDKDVIYQSPASFRIGIITSGPESEVTVKGYHKTEQKNFGSVKVIWLEKNSQN